jgi:late competence protein required for DNA uptake (superfamily II DNA/RNA helicase)
MQLIDQRCWHHPNREAVVRCPGCSRFYCRECVVEHLGRMVCSDCVAAKKADVSAASFSYVRWTALAAGGFLLAWLIFYYLGVTLARIPSDFFE